jgi:hypothetical protein
MRQIGHYPKVSPYPACAFEVQIGRAFKYEMRYSRIDLLNSARHLFELIERDMKIIPYRYIYKITRFMGLENLDIKGVGITTGVLIDGKCYSISGGNGECVLEEMAQTSLGKWDKVKSIDIRDKKRIATDAWGDILISKRKVPFNLHEELPKLIEFLEGANDREVKVFSYDKTPSIKELLSMASEGMGVNDWAIEEFSNRGEEGKKQLIEILKQNTLKEYHLTAAQLLFLVFPGEQTKTIIKDHIDKLPDEQEEKDFIILLAAFSGENEKK